MDIGALVPNFTLPDETGTPRSLGEFLAHGPVVLFFYPAAMSGGCTKEACHFRDLGAEFRAADAQRVGISPDAPDKQRTFSERHGFDYPCSRTPTARSPGSSMRTAAGDRCTPSARRSSSVRTSA